VHHNCSFGESCFFAGLVDCDFETWRVGRGELDCAHVTATKAKARGTATGFTAICQQQLSLKRGLRLRA